MVESLVLKVEVRRGESRIRSEEHHANLSDVPKGFGTSRHIEKYWVH